MCEQNVTKKRKSPLKYPAFPAAEKALGKEIRIQEAKIATLKKTLEILKDYDKVPFYFLQSAIDTARKHIPTNSRIKDESLGDVLEREVRELNNMIKELEELKGK